MCCANQARLPLTDLNRSNAHPGPLRATIKEEELLSSIQSKKRPSTVYIHSTLYTAISRHESLGKNWIFGSENENFQ